MAQILDGKALAKKMKEQVAAEAAALPRKPGLAVILVGENPASQVYVRGKEKDCDECGILNLGCKIPAETSEEELLDIIAKLNADPAVDGILVQLPLPKHIDEGKVLRAISPAKDVDCFHPENVGEMMVGDPICWPCTPFGVMELLREYGISANGKHCVVLGRSNIVGKPMTLLLLRDNGTVTVCHSRTPDLKEQCLKADILVAAVGKVNLVTADMVKEGAVVIDVAMNRNDEGKLCGDVDYAAVAEKASFITPVPGGVGPMTRAVLMHNVLAAAKDHQK
ncbi:MAG: bifunctional methylenetetrahydrofolate dehydrogenase/methenyltetrahydrofolate cyclohydrolase FolD [Clostridia bacterium]|nr:bifunctional methylenetetrahydrofolate dehydrogenase/methenyltetrahydrofolate cyclohydrolase FolD [Clostridia bacterium]